MDKIRLYHIDDSEDSQHLVKKFINEHPDIRLIGSSKSPTEGLEEISRIYPDIVLIDENTVPKDLTFLIQKLLLQSPYIGIIVSSSEHSLAKMKQYMNVGARDYLAKPFHSSDLVYSITEVYEYISRVKKHIVANSSKILIRAPQMITVFSTKGGVGKSTIAALLSSGLSTIYRENTAIVDLDLQFGDITLLMDVKPKTTISNVIEVIERLDSEDIRKFLYKHSTGVQILASPFKPEEAEFITDAALDRMFTFLKNEFDYIVVDSPPSFTDQAIIALEQSDVILFVTSPELVALKNTKLGIGTLKELGIDTEKIKIVVNRFSKKSHFPVPLIEEVLGLPVFTTISDDYLNVIEFLNQGQPQLFYQGKGAMKKDMLILMESLRQYYTVIEKQKRKRKWFKFLKEIRRK